MEYPLKRKQKIWVLTENATEKKGNTERTRKMIKWERGFGISQNRKNHHSCFREQFTPSKFEVHFLHCPLYKLIETTSLKQHTSRGNRRQLTPSKETAIKFFRHYCMLISSKTFKNCRWYTMIVEFWPLEVRSMDFSAPAALFDRVYPQHPSLIFVHLNEWAPCYERSHQQTSELELVASIKTMLFVVHGATCWAIQVPENLLWKHYFNVVEALLYSVHRGHIAAR